MAGAIVRGAIDARVIAPGELALAEPDPAKRALFDALGVRTTSDFFTAARALEPETQILLAIKPQSLAEVARDAVGIDLSGRIIITILAGATTELVRRVMGGACRVVRVMPNLPASIGQGCTAIALGAGAAPGDEALAHRLFSAVGPVVEHVDESLMDAFTAVAGSGPAYVFYLAEAMERAAVALGFDPAMARRVVRQTIAGAASMLTSPDALDSPAMRAAVTSKGGTTEAACRVLDESRVMDAYLRALAAARDRGRELSASADVP